MIKTKKTSKIDFTVEDEKAIFSAAARTWGEVASDAAELGPPTVAMAIELVLDADRIVSIGGLDENTYTRLLAIDWKVCDAWMKKNRSRWY